MWGEGQLCPGENTVRIPDSLFYQKQAQMAKMASIDVCKNWSGIFQSLEIAMAFFKIA
jgi:hypothetical protein